MFRRIAMYDNPQQWWRNTTFTYKFYVIINVVIFCGSFFAPVSINQLLIDYPLLTIGQHQYWRIFFAFWGQFTQIYYSLNLFFGLYWLMFLFEDEKKSTVYTLLQAFFYNLIIHVLYNAVCYYFFSLNPYLLGYSYEFGWFPVILVYQFMWCAQHPEANRYFCFIPCPFKAKYFVWIITFLFILASRSIICYLCAIAFGAYQGYIHKRNIVGLPHSFYTKFQSCLPKFITSRHDFTRYSDREEIHSGFQVYNDHQVHMQERQENQPARQENLPARVVAEGSPVMIGGESSKGINSQQKWLFRDRQDEKQQRNQLEIEPQGNYRQNQYQETPYQTLDSPLGQKYESQKETETQPSKKNIN